jgi:hypothetical protein
MGGEQVVFDLERRGVIGAGAIGLAGHTGNLPEDERGAGAGGLVDRLGQHALGFVGRSGEVALFGREPGECQTGHWIEWLECSHKPKRVPRQLRVGAFRQYRGPPRGQGGAFAAHARVFHQRLGVHCLALIFAHVFKTFWAIP